MSAIYDSGGIPTARWLDRLRRARLLLAAAAIVFAGLWATGSLAAFPALAGFVLIVAAALVTTVGAQALAPAQPSAAPATPRAGDPLVEAVLTGLPDPVVALDHRGDVVALNAQASAVAPALRRGEPVSLGLRVPEVLDAIRRARTSGTTQRVEFFQRVPLDRWFEAVVTPILSAGDAPEPGLMLLEFHDLTPLRRVEEMRADFVANASHELRTPLASLSGFIDTLQGPGARGYRGARALSRDHAGAGQSHGAPDRRSSVAFTHRAQCPSAPGQAGRSRRHLAPGGRYAADAGPRSRRRGQADRARWPDARAGRPRRIDPGVREPRGERA